MNHKQIISKSEIHDELLQGVHKITNVVKTTLGPGGLPILVERTGQALNGDPLGPMITKDGVTVADECFDPDPKVDLAIQSIKSTCRRTNKVAGDGTSTSIVLGEAILKNALEAIQSNPELNPQTVKAELEKSLNDSMEILESYSTPIEEDSSLVEKVATISSNGDEDIGRIIREAVETVGSEGAITVDEGHSTQTELEVVEGFQIERGAEAQDRFFNNKENTAFEAEKCHVLLFDGKLTNYSQLVTPFQNIEQEMKEANKKEFPPVLVVANEFSQEVIAWLLMQKNYGISTCAVKSPHTTTIRTQMLDDMGVMLGGERLGNGNRDLGNSSYEDIGVCDKVKVSKYKTTFYDGYGTEEAIKERIDQLKAQKEVAETPYDAGIISDRISALAQGIAKIGVGGFTEMEVKEKYHRIEDALNASRAAIQQGVLPGSGTSLYKLSKDLYAKTETGDSVGKEILRSALQEPFCQIVKNLGLDSEKMRKELENRLSQASDVVYNGKTGEFESAFASGVLDPLKVTKTALENAVSIASLLFTCGGGIIIEREK